MKNPSIKREDITGWILALEIGGEVKGFLKEGEEVTPLDRETTKDRNEAKVFNSWGEADDFRSRIYIASPDSYPELTGWVIHPTDKKVRKPLKLSGEMVEVDLDHPAGSNPEEVSE